MKVRLIPSAPPNSPASKTTLSRGDAWPDLEVSVVIQSSWANTNAAKSTSWESSTSLSRVDRPGLNVVVQGSTSATSSRPRVIPWRSLACLPDDPRKMRGMFMRDSPDRISAGAHRTRSENVSFAGNTWDGRWASWQCAAPASMWSADPRHGGGIHVQVPGDALEAVAAMGQEVVVVGADGAE